MLPAAPASDSSCHALPPGDQPLFANRCVFCLLLLQAALTVVGRMLHLHSHAFGFAGTKDRRGITTQYVTLFKVDPRKLAALNPRCGQSSSLD